MWLPIAFCAVGLWFFVAAFSWFYRHFHLLSQISVNLDGAREAAIDSGPHYLWLAAGNLMAAAVFFYAAYFLSRKRDSSRPA